MGNDKRPPDGDGPEGTKTATDPPGDEEGAAPETAGATVVEIARPRNGAGRSRSLGRKIKDYLN